jgi:hypothetical protein
VALSLLVFIGLVVVYVNWRELANLRLQLPL